ncbi:MAG TPA: chromosomal replication initiator protein DnaA [Candidatus Krumholzibacteria bacterium]|nr:chromosomal replication initiator protein DnaA [Candidatus Krumholzibacteria bacterium]
MPRTEDDPSLQGRPNSTLWGRILDRVRAKVNPQSFSTWFEPTRLVEVHEGELVVEGPNQFFVDWLAEHHLERIEEAALQILGKRPRVTLRIASGPHGPQRIARAPERAETKPARTPEKQALAHGLDTRYAFADFVIGANCQLSCAACLAVAEKPGRTYNPLFIYGGVGLGKTHLLQAIGNFVVEEHGLRVHYTSSETFMNELILAIRQGRTLEFKNRYRSVDVLLIDDIQFLSGKAGTQEEFFHTFNHLFSAKKQIVIASDRPPKEIDSLEERLQSRFECGLITDLAPPDFETRVAILRKKVEAQGAEVADDVLHHIARGVTSNIRELEGSLVRLLAFASLTGQPMTVHMAEEALRGFLRPQRREVRIATIQKVVANEFGVTVEALKSKSRAQRVAFPRQTAVYLTRELTGIPLVEIGKRFGGRDHTTILHAYGKIARLARQDSSLQERLEKMRRLLLFS